MTHKSSPAGSISVVIRIGVYLFNILPLSFCGTPQGGGAGRPHQTVTRPFAKLDRLYAAQLRYDEIYRREWSEKAGLGFELGELGYKFEAPIRPALVA